MLHSIWILTHKRTTATDTNPWEVLGGEIFKTSVFILKSCMSGFLHAWSASGHNVCVFVCTQGRKAPVHNYADLQIIKLIWLCFNSSTRPVFSARSLSFVFLPTARSIRRKYVNAHSEQFSFAFTERYTFYSTEQIGVNDYNWSPNELTNRSIDSNDSFGTNLSEWFKYLLKYSKRHSPVANCLSRN